MNTNWNDPNFQGFGRSREPRQPRERKAVGTPLGRTLLNIAVTLVFAAVFYYVVLPPINLKSEEFYIFVLLARLKLADTARAVLKNGMTLIGCSAPEKM